MATTLDPVGYPDGVLSGWTKFFGGHDIGKDQAAVADRFVAYNGGYNGGGYYGASIYQTAISSRANHYISIEAKNSPTNGIRLFWNSSADGGTSGYYISIGPDGGWRVSYDGGTDILYSGPGMVTGVGAGVSYTLSVDASVQDSPVIKLNGAVLGSGGAAGTLAVGSLTPSRSGSYVGVFLDASSNAGVIQIEPFVAPVPATDPEYGFVIGSDLSHVGAGEIGAPDTAPDIPAYWKRWSIVSWQTSSLPMIPGTGRDVKIERQWETGRLPYYVGGTVVTDTEPMRLRWGLVTWQTKALPMLPGTGRDSKTERQWEIGRLPYYSGSAFTSKTYVRTAGAWVLNTIQPSVRVSGAWVTATGVHVRIAGAWVKVQ